MVDLSRRKLLAGAGGLVSGYVLGSSVADDDETADPGPIGAPDVDSGMSNPLYLNSGEIHRLAANVLEEYDGIEWESGGELVLESGGELVLNS